MKEEILKILKNNQGLANAGVFAIFYDDYPQCAEEIVQMVCDKIIEKFLAPYYKNSSIRLTHVDWADLNNFGMTDEQIQRSLEKLK